MWITVRRAAEIKKCSDNCIRLACRSGRLSRRQFNGKPNRRGSKVFVLFDERFEEWIPGRTYNAVDSRIGHVNWHEVADIYNSGVPVMHIATKMGISRETVSNHLKRNGYRIMNGKYAQRQYANK